MEPKNLDKAIEIKYAIDYLVSFRKKVIDDLCEDDEMLKEGGIKKDINKKLRTGICKIEREILDSLDAMLNKL